VNKPSSNADSSLTLLGIETSCDETAAAIVSATVTDDGLRGEIRSNAIFSQIDEHAAFGGVVPEIAARAHADKIDIIVRQALSDANTNIGDVDAIAATAGPGLLGGLIVGLTSAKSIASALKMPLYAINHLEGHALTPRLTDGVAFPYMLLLVSGGHTQIVLVEGVGEYTRLGTTIDDALGEAFDKTAKLLGLGYPGGPAVEKWAARGTPGKIELPRPMVGKHGYDFSFSGLKTAVRRAAQLRQPVTENDIADICAAFQATVCDVMEDRVGRALNDTVKSLGHPLPLVVAGGVAANMAIRFMLENLASSHGTQLIAPPLDLCTDNAAMIAWAGLERMVLDMPSDPLDIAPRSRWPLDETAQSRIGFGKRGAKA
jgi:N6-L-threonylcarbamoyladenine synthase